MDRFTLIDSPIGQLLICSDGINLTGLYTEKQIQSKVKLLAPDNKCSVDDLPLFVQTQRELNEYFAGARTEFSLPLKPYGTEFQKQVWQELRHIDYATTISYGELANRLGKPAASRAVGNANGKNPISIIIPCHRVIGTNGALTGYAGGIECKKRLLHHEINCSLKQLARV